jgi:hypothetical protein
MAFYSSLSDFPPLSAIGIPREPSLNHKGMNHLHIERYEMLRQIVRYWDFSSRDRTVTEPAGPSHSPFRSERPIYSNGHSIHGQAAHPRTSETTATRERHIKAFDPAVLAAMKPMEAVLDVVSKCSPTA